MTDIIKIAPQEDFVSSTLRIHNADSDDLPLLAKIANPEFQTIPDNMWRIPEVSISVVHNSAQNVYGEPVYLLDIDINHFHLHQSNLSVGETVYTGRISSFTAYKEMPDFANEQNNKSFPPRIYDFEGMNVIMVHSIVRNKAHSDRIVEAFTKNN